MHNLSISCAVVCVILLASAALLGTFGILKRQISAILITGVMYILAGSLGRASVDLAGEQPLDPINRGAETAGRTPWEASRLPGVSGASGAGNFSQLRDAFPLSRRFQFRFSGDG